MNGKSVYSCSVLAIDAQGKAIETIEGIAEPGKLHPVSAAFWNHDAQQCGYCTPGFVMAAKGFLAEHPNPNLEDVEHGLGGNLCRCGTYMGVRQAVLEAARTLKTQGGKNG
jgi:aerobic-type carbon monoxide dehydrogenase small subunit (CoxS/CutS family)